jgi:O-antigen/teichoic acid export membrane protein
VLKNIYIRLGANAFIEAINFVTSVLLFRAFGAEIIGLIAYYYSLAGICSLFTDLGISTAYNKFIASEQRHEDITAYLFLKLLLIGLYVVIFFGVYFLKLRTTGLDDMLLFILFLGFFLDLLGQIFTSTFIGRRDFAYLSKVGIISSVILAGYNLIVCFVIRDKYFLAGNKIILPMMTIAAGIIYFHNKKIFRLEPPRWVVIKKYVSYSLPIAFSSIVSQFTSYFDKLIVGKLVGIEEVGWYQIALRCYTVLDNFVRPVTETLFTEIIHRIANVPSFFHKKFRDLVEVLSFSGSVITIGIVFLSTPMIYYLLGAGNIRGAFILKFFSLALLAKLFWRPYQHVLYAIEKHKWILYPLPVQLVVMVACYYFLIPLKLNGFYLGAAALPLTEFIIWILPGGLITIYLLKKEYGNIHMAEIILKTGLPLLIVVVAGYMFKFSLLALPVLLILFLAVEYIFKVINKERWNQLVEPLNLAFLKI